ncbi:MAG TPA: MG2 domain-containing protein [Polyangiaceae bacterium]|nr:MG2 domain-containing protein [Polyangiaceae bacterium]
MRLAPHSIPSLRSRHFRTAPFAFLLAAVACIGVACGDGDGRPRSTVVIGDGDRAENGVLSINEANIRGTIEDGTMTVNVPVTSLVDRDTSGTLSLRLLSVDGKEELGVVELPYSLTAQESATLNASLDAPEGIEAQQDLVGFNVRVDDGSTKGLRVTRSLLYVIPQYDLRVEGPAALRQSREGYYRVRVQDALDNRPLEGQEVTFEVLQNDEVVQTETVTTEMTGDASMRVQLDSPGDFKVRAAMKAQGTSAKLEDPIKVDGAAGKLLLTTDKPIYQPGQIINLRALALSHDGNKPQAGASATFEIEDAKGNKIFKKSIKTDKYGIAYTTFLLGKILNQGTFKIRVITGDVTTEKTVSVSPYALPKFDVIVQTEDPWYAPGTTISGSIDSRYFFGKAVAGSVRVEGYSIDVGQTLFQTVMGTLSADGHYDFSLQLPVSLPGLPLGQGSAAIELRVTVTDSAGQKVEKSRLVTVSAQSATVSLVPEAGKLVPGVENELLLFATDPLGSPLANAAVRLTAPDGSRLAATTDAFGQAVLAWTPASDQASKSTTPAPLTFSAALTLDGGSEVTATFDFSAQSGADHLLLRTDKSVYEVGETVKVNITSTEETGTVYVDWINDGQTVDMRTLTADAGSATFSMPVDTTLAGSNRIEAYLVDADGQIVRTGRTIFARSDAALKVEVTSDQELYAPGTPAKLTLSVTDEAGAPAVAALGLQIVDQAVFALVDAKPGLLRTYFEIEDQLSQPQYEIHPPSVDFSSALFHETSDSDEDRARAAQQRTGAALAAMKNTSLTGIQHGSLSEVLTAAKANLVPTFTSFKTELEPRLKTLVTQTVAVLELRGCEMYGQCQNGDSYQVAFAQELEGRLDVFDFWGNAFKVVSDYQLTLTSSGPDEKLMTADDEALTYDLYALGLRSDTDQSGGFPEAPNAGGPFPSGNTGGTGNVGIPGGAGSMSMSPDGPGEMGPRVRRDFPETLYVNPSVITGADGTATIEVGMADSITEWRVSALANAADGRLGGSESGITVFQDFFVDVSFPAALTRGDEVSFPIAVYNYLDVPQTVHLELQPGTWYTALGPTTSSVQLAPGQVTGVSFPVKVNDVGLRTLTVVATGTEKSDAVARTVRVVPDGKAFPAAFSGSLNTPTITQSVSFPASAVPGSGQLYLDVFPAFLAQAVQGMDSILAEPNGCFEQTTSSAWPNVLVTEYMKETDQITPEIEMKAEALMSTGYQRLLTFEHPGGGFSWFGTQDPAPFLSVTAFGIMEFSDMARVHQIDESMLARTVAWILSQQEADGSFKGDMSEFFSFHTSQVRNTAFTAWALASAGETGAGVQDALAYVKANLGSDNDAYTLGIVANAFAVGAPSDALLTDVLGTLESLKKTEGDGVYWDAGDTQTNFYGAGNDAAVASTALVAHAMLLAGSYPSTVEAALHYLTSKKDPSGNFGSTQATIWALRTLLLSAKKGTTGAVGNLTVSVDGVAMQTVALSEAQADVMTRVDLSILATAGPHDVKLDFAGTGKPSFNLVSSHHLPWALVPAEPPGPLSIDVTYDKTDLFVDDTVKATVTLTNNEPVTQNMVLVTLGIAPGFSVDTEDLQKHLDSGAISKFEMTGRQLILYITALAPSSMQTFEYDLQATMPVTAVDGGAEARMYYEPEKKARAAACELRTAAR